MIFAVKLPTEVLFFQTLGVDMMKITDWITAVCAVCAVIVSVVALILAIKSKKDSSESVKAATRSADAAERSHETSKEIFKKQGVMALFESWSNVKDIDRASPIAVDAIRAAQALNLTATLWENEIVDRKIILQSFWENYEHLFDTLSSVTTPLPGFTKSGKDLITGQMESAYEAMKSEASKQPKTSDAGQQETH